MIKLNETYSSGAGWQETFRANLALIPEPYRSFVSSEASIRWSVQGGSPSSIYWDVLKQVVRELNNDIEPQFPHVEWNNRHIESERQRMGLSR